MTFTEISHELRMRILPVRLVIFDVDGVLTDGRIIYHDDGSEIKAFDVQDGHGIKLLQRAGIDVALVTGRYCRAVDNRAEGLGIKKVYQGVHYKVEAYEKILSETGLKDEEVGYVGDDLIDIPVMRRVGFAVAVSNATSHVMPYAHYVTRARGGSGAGREVCELILQVQGRWEKVTQRYFQS
ncbi:KdsC family phosphatase [Desulforhabdus amnigena]|uniref:3-deoxy-D-manno-octulosonate 8-phosphate phosphatase KdsC n=1 Tax=Desulforhabdus amnigena TaxID=40218 RepID=A0A9W6FWF7_9BACT|nr:HAD-IIIA family hydrolase [Desulforhabdus amnigena]GLI36199.1 haloacid dehalogenase [Desulforhabdus amnigena]